MGDLNVVDTIEFRAWLTDVCRKFPAIGDWLRGLKPEDDGWRAHAQRAGFETLLESWQVAMADLRLGDCLAVNQLMVSGQARPPGHTPGQWQGLPALMRANVAALAAERTPALSAQDEREHCRTVMARELFKTGQPRSAVNRVLAAAGYEPVATAEDVQRHVVSTGSPSER